jgi:hypothetical protein
VIDEELGPLARLVGAVGVGIDLVQRADADAAGDRLEGGRRAR